MGIQTKCYYTGTYIFDMRNMSDKVGEYDGYVGTGPTMMPHFRKKHSVFIKYSKKDIILGILLALAIFYVIYYICGVMFSMPLQGM